MRNYLFAVLFLGVLSNLAFADCDPLGMYMNLTMPPDNSTYTYGSNPPFIFTMHNSTGGNATCALQAHLYVWEEYKNMTVYDDAENVWNTYDDLTPGNWTWRIACTENESDPCATAYSDNYSLRITEPTYCSTCPINMTYQYGDVDIPIGGFLFKDLLGMVLILLGLWAIYHYVMFFVRH